MHHCDPHCVPVSEPTLSRARRNFRLGEPAASGGGVEPSADSGAPFMNVDLPDSTTPVERWKGPPWSSSRRRCRQFLRLCRRPSLGGYATIRRTVSMAVTRLCGSQRGGPKKPGGGGSFLGGRTGREI